MAESDTHSELLQKGNEAYQAGDLEEAGRCYQTCLDTGCDRPIVRYNLGAVCLDLDRLDEAARHLQHGLALGPDRAGAHNKMGIICLRQRRAVEAIQHYRRAIQMNPDFASAHFNLGMALLEWGQWEEGWREYEWRWQTDTFEPFECPHPKWRGRTRLDKTLLIHTEQGNGDAIQFVRLVAEAAKRVQRVILVCIPELQPLFQGVPGIDEFRAAGQIAAQSFDLYCPLMSLPTVLGMSLTTFPPQQAYLSVPAEHQQRCDEAIFAKEDENAPPPFRVGVAWAGSRTNPTDRRRSCTFDQFAPLLRTPGVSFYSLQKLHTDEDLAAMREHNVKDLSGHLNDFADTAAVINRLDLVIAVDTVVNHIAGAIGKPTWNLLCYSPDWRWMMERTDTPWYPTMRLWRQAQPDAWDELIGRVANELAVQAKSAERSLV